MTMTPAASAFLYMLTKFSGAKTMSPKTGDENILLLWVIILAAATVYLVARKRRLEAEEGGYPA